MKNFIVQFGENRRKRAVIRASQKTKGSLPVKSPGDGIRQTGRKGKKDLFVTGCMGILVVAIVVVSVFGFGGESVAASSEMTNWGLSFQKEGECPVGNADAATLKQYDAYFVGDSSSKTIYLTFDAGYENGHTEEILDALKKHNAKGTFFLVGNYLETAPELVKRMCAEGHVVGNHTYTHPDMSAVLDEESFLTELRQVEEKFREITGEEMSKLYRPPQGKYCVENLKMAQKAGYKTIFWSLAYVDWYNDKQPTKEEAFSKLIPRVHPGAIILLHSTSETNGEILDELLTKYEEMGYSFGDITELTA